MLFQPTNITPSKFGGLGNGIVDANENLAVSWQVNGNSAMTKFKIDIFQNNAASTPVYSTGVKTDGCPFYGTNYDGTVQFFSYTISAAALSAAGMQNGGEYKLVITQYWSASDYVTQSSASAFSTKAFPSLALTNPTAGAVVTSNRLTATASYSQAQGDALNWIRWQIASYDDGEFILLDDTGDIFGTALLQYDFDGLFSGESYAIRCDIETESGVQTTTGWIVFSVSYSTSEIGGSIGVQCVPEVSGLKLTLPPIRNIPAVLSGGTSLSDSRLTLEEGASAVWETVDGEPMDFGAPMNVVWRSVGETDGTFLKLKTGDTETLTAECGLDPIPEVSVNSVLTADYNRIVAGDGVWLAYERYNGKLSICENGYTWSAQFQFLPESMGNEILSICYGDNGFAAICRENYNMTIWLSGNGKSWEKVYISHTGAEDAGIAFADGRYIAINYYYDAYGDDLLDFLASSNGINWQKTDGRQGSGLEAPEISKIGSTWVAVNKRKNAGTFSTYYSEDNGISWLQGTNIVKRGCHLKKVNGKLFALKNAQNADYSYYTTDGINWTSVGLTNTSDIVYFNGKYYAATGGNSTTTTIKQSTDLSTWTNVTTLTIFSPRMAVGAYGIVAFPDMSHTTYSTARIYRTMNGSTWKYNSVSLGTSSNYSVSEPIYDVARGAYIFASIDGKIVRVQIMKKVTVTDGSTTVTHQAAFNAMYMTLIIGTDKSYFSYVSDAGLNKIWVYHYFSINTIQRMELDGVQSCDYLIVSDGEISDAVRNNILEDMSYHPDTVATHFYADFLYNANGGAVAGTTIIGWSIYRYTYDEPIMRHIADLNVGDGTVLYDCGVTNGQTVQYFAFALSASTYATDSIQSELVSPCDWSWVLLSCKRGEDGAYHPQEVFKFRNNTAVSSISNNNEANILPNFTRYPTVQRSNQNYKSGSLTSLIGQIVRSRYSDTIEERDAVYALSSTDNTLFLKSRKGDLIKIRIAGAISMETMNNSAGQEQTVTLPWVETGSAANDSIILTSTDALWGA